MKTLEKKASKSDPPKAFGREVLADTLADSRIGKIQETLSEALKGMGIEAQIAFSEEKNLVSIFKVIIEGREIEVAIGNSVADAQDPAAEIQNVLKMFGLGVK
jgi:hypothetical protein